MRRFFFLPFCQLRCYADSSFRGGFGHVRQYQRIRERTWSRIRCYPSNHPIPNPERRMMCVIGEYSHRNTTECFPRYMLSRYCESQPRSWWHRWKRSLDILQKKNCGNLWRVPCWKLNSPLSEREKWRRHDKSVVSLKSMIYY